MKWSLLGTPLPQLLLTCPSSAVSPTRQKWESFRSETGDAEKTAGGEAAPLSLWPPGCNHRGGATGGPARGPAAAADSPAGASNNCVTNPFPVAFGAQCHNSWLPTAEPTYLHVFGSFTCCLLWLFVLVFMMSIRRWLSHHKRVLGDCDSYRNECP